MNTHHNYILVLFTGIIIFSSSCNKFIEIPGAKNQIETNVIFADSTVATAAILSAYSTIATNVNAGNKYLGLYTDEYIHTAPGVGTTLLQFNQSLLSAINNDNTTLWAGLYSCIYQCNAIIEGTEQSTGLSATAKKQFKAEAKFLRAYANFYLVNLYDHIPLLLSTDVNLNKRASQTDKQTVYNQISKDLLDATTELDQKYIGTEKVRANSLAASALLARLFLYQNNWDEAERQASRVINSGTYSPLPKLEDVFLANSKEAIFQLWNQNGFIGDATSLIPASATVLPPYVIRPELEQAFETTDGRKSKWIATNIYMGSQYNYPSKYKNRSANAAKPEYVMALRLTEQYLIRAEAHARQNHIEAAVADLNTVRSRAGGLLPLADDISKQVCLDAIAKERRLELFGEWGHRFMDLKRTGTLDAVMEPLKTTWKITAKALPIPNAEVIYNNNLNQNDGY